MPTALTHTRITWSLSPMAAQVPGVTLGPPCVHGVGGTPYGEVRNMHPRCVLGVVRLEVCLIAGLLPWSSGKCVVYVAPFVN